jgi:hypothetical protein
VVGPQPAAHEAAELEKRRAPTRTHRHGNLVEAACNRDGANGLLGAWHVLSRHRTLERRSTSSRTSRRAPQPDDKLKPAHRRHHPRHVREGLALSENKLPRSLRAFITEHHGTNRIVYFYEKARERAEGHAPNAAEYAYGGPLPRSAETAICMLADGVEAAARALPDPSAERFRELVERIVRQRLDQGQLRDAPITLAQLEKVKEQFVRVLLGMYHGRIDYPTAPTAAAPAAPAAPLVNVPPGPAPGSAPTPAGVGGGATHGAAQAPRPSRRRRARPGTAARRRRSSPPREPVRRHRAPAARRARIPCT